MLGNLTTDPMAIQLSASGPGNVQVNVPTADSGASSGGNLWAGISNFISKATEVINKAAPAVTQVQNAIKTAQSTYNPNLTVQQQQAVQAPAPGMSTTTKILLGVGAAAAIGGLIYVASK